ncbi:MAG: glycosyl hydrolase [Verrucomicrobia bacterium]|nr:glycosyl hydrolase [Verrucomicrobiota bacterium]
MEIRRCRKILAGIMALVIGSALAAVADEALGPLAWPQPTKESRPWSYWWWMGSAVDKENLTKELTRYRDAGWGGVHIIPIYGAKGWESKFIEYLSPQWMEMLRHTVSEARRLGMDVDMTTGTGWCFGGPNVPPQEASAQVVAKIVEEGGKKVFQISQKPTSKVKRPAAGGEGYMLNPLYADAIRHWLGRFTEAFARYDGPKPRAQYHDSFEYRVDWSPDLLAQFEKRRGYRLQSEFPAFFGRETNDRVARLKCDYRETISDMMIEDSMPLWFNWCRERGFLTRNQAHGSPGNLLDLYALADIPETEMFHTDRRPLVAKFASSAAHVAGHNLVASETGTWLKEHFTETLADVQGLLDDLFVSGINHVIFHGTCYSPDEAGWPGWLFYASTEMNPRNSIWRDVPTLAGYIARCQSVLQAGRPDNDVLVYWPIYDVWHKAAGLAENLTVHGAGWFGGQPIGKLAEKLWARGFTFDYISDRQLAALKPAGRVIVVPTTEHIPLKTMEHLLRLAEGGAKVIFDEALPKDVPGLRTLEARQAELKKLLERANGCVQVGDAEALLARAGVAREQMVDHTGLLFIRRKLDGGRYYFIANRSDKPVDGWLPLATKAKSVTIMDPMTGCAGVASLADGSKVYVQLAPGDSVVLRTFADRTLDGPAWAYWKPAGDPVTLSGSWKVKFLRGGPALPPAFGTAKLSSWTELGGKEAQRFAGTALYTLTFDAPAAGAGWWLDLGNVCQSARVRLNGSDLGTAIKPPFRVAVDALKQKGNMLDVEVTNVSANRIRDLDRRGMKWHNFYDIGFVNINYKPFDASNWPLADSGLLGPVTLQPMKTFAPK